MWALIINCKYGKLERRGRRVGVCGDRGICVMRRILVLAVWLLTPVLAAAQSAPTGGAIIYASSYGVLANTGADETISMQAALTACSGDVLQLPAGQINISSTLIGSAPCIVAGTGSSAGFSPANPAATNVNEITVGQGGFAFASIDGVVVRDLGITMPLGAAGNGILIQSGAINNLNRGSHIQNVSVWGGGTSVYLFHSANYTVKDSFLLNFSQDGIYADTDSNMPDIGDSEISGNTIWDFNVTTGNAGIRLDPQGGMEILGNKLLGATFGIWLTVSQGPTGTLNIAQNSLEQQNVAHVYIQQTNSAATYADITITGNEMENYGISTFQDGIAVTNPGAQYLQDLAITGNTIRDCGTLYGLINIQSVTGAAITGNILDGCGSGTPGVSLGSNAIDVTQTGNVVH